MKNISLKLDELIFGEVEKIRSHIQKPRNRYINDALAYYNSVQKRKMLEKSLNIESNLVSEHSIEVVQEFENIDLNTSR